MFKKSFVSLYFLPGELQLIQLGASKKKVKKYATISLPEGLISNYKVTDRKALAKILKSTWKKLQLKERSVFVVIPEFSTFVKLFELADVDISELNEAVGWQVREFLPETLKETMMDWKIIRKEKNVYQILAVAVNKEILNGYIHAVEDAGLFPLVVEIPSLSLTRIAGNDKEASLVIYLGSKDAVLVILDKNMVLGSAVVQDREAKDIESTARRMSSHFKEIKISKLIVGGVNIDKNLIGRLSESFKIKVKLLSRGIKGLKEEEIQNYLIPISSQLQEPAEPVDPFSLNLLPAKLVDKYKSKKLKLQVWGLMLTITLFVSISFLLTLGVYLFITQQITDFKSKNTATFQLAKKREEATMQVKEINMIVDKVSKIQKVDILPQEVLNDITKASIEGIAINKYVIDFDKGMVVFSGIAFDRQSLLTFKQNLELNPKISQLDVPISSFEQEFNLEFEASFLYSKEILNQKKGAN
jgi:DNA-binding ferritin-like protein (Dps family)